MDIKTAIFKYCNYQERCHSEVQNKLYELGADTNEVNQLLVDMIEAGLLNEERFARNYARGRFRIKHWGRMKIIQHLKQKKISAYCIQKAMTEIDPNEYFETAVKLCKRKLEELKKDKEIVRKNKAYRYLQQKGYESSIIQEILKDLLAKTS